MLFKIVLDGDLYIGTLASLPFGCLAVRFPGSLLRLFSLLAHPLVEFLYLSSSGRRQVTIFGAIWSTCERELDWRERSVLGLLFEVTVFFLRPFGGCLVSS